MYIMTNVFIHVNLDLLKGRYIIYQLVCFFKVWIELMYCEMCYSYKLKNTGRIQYLQGIMIFMRTHLFPYLLCSVCICSKLYSFTSLAFSMGVSEFFVVQSIYYSYVKYVDCVVCF